MVKNRNELPRSVKRNTVLEHTSISTDEQVTNQKTVERIIRCIVNEGEWVDFMALCHKHEADPFEYLSIGVREEVKKVLADPSLLG